MQGKKSPFVQHWWSKAWLASVESEDPPRMQRGKSYARHGKVDALEIEASKGIVKAQVKGSRRNPYSVVFSFSPFAILVRESLERILEAQGEQLEYGLPHDWELQLQGMGQTLLPDLLTEMSFHCSCPDWSIPCKHTMAVACVLAAKMDAEGGLLLELRGMNIEKYKPSLVQPMGPPLDTSLHQFWGLPLQETELMLPREIDAPLLQQLGAMPGGIISRRRLKEALEPVYQNTRQVGADLLSELLKKPEPPTAT